MPFEKGQKKTGGRAKGVENKSTSEVRKNFNELFDGNISKVQDWLDKTAKRSPAKALELFLKLSEFVVPKAKQEIEIRAQKIIVKPINKKQ